MENKAGHDPYDSFEEDNLEELHDPDDRPDVDKELFYRETFSDSDNAEENEESSNVHPTAVVTGKEEGEHAVSLPTMLSGEHSAEVSTSPGPEKRQRFNSASSTAALAEENEEELDVSVPTAC